MSGLQPKGEALRKAVHYIGQRRLDDPGASVARLIEEAALEFDLSPLDESFLWKTLVEHEPRKPEPS